MGWVNTGKRRSLTIKVFKNEDTNYFGTNPEIIYLSGQTSGFTWNGNTHVSLNDTEFAQLPLTGDTGFYRRASDFKSFVEFNYPTGLTSQINWSLTGLSAELIIYITTGNTINNYQRVLTTTAIGSNQEVWDPQLEANVTEWVITGTTAVTQEIKILVKEIYIPNYGWVTGNTNSHSIIPIDSYSGLTTGLHDNNTPKLIGPPDWYWDNFTISTNGVPEYEFKIVNMMYDPWIIYSSSAITQSIY